MFSHKTDDWSTPKQLLTNLTNEFGELIDPCPLRTNEDCLTKQWKGKLFINPPYSKIKEFTNYFKEYKELIVWLLPARTDTKWFHENFYLKKNVEIRFIKGRLKFGEQKNSAPFPSMLVIQNG